MFILWLYLIWNDIKQQSEFQLEKDEFQHFRVLNRLAKELPSKIIKNILWFWKKIKQKSFISAT